jgi:hypothetical protein
MHEISALLYRIECGLQHGTRAVEIRLALAEIPTHLV